MAYTKKKWVDVPDPSNLPSIPEGQDSLARFDAENMNRMEDGIKESFEHTKNKSNPHEVKFSQIEGALPISKGGTGNTNSTNAANSLSVKTLGNGTSIPENADLNSYTNAGNYVCSMTSTAQSLSNCPITSAFNMTVYLANGSSSYLIQELTHFISGVKYFRSYSKSSDAWGEWQSVYSTNNTPSKTFNINISKSWTANSNGGYTNTINVEGILSTDNPIVDIVLGSDVEANKLYLEAWDCISRIITADKSITLYAYNNKPEIAFTMQLKVVR